ncbi:MAG: 1-acyl-sn-glycerol-3-phosphate acyltransferase [Alphaproteobacteria bacterium]|nr:1-acyl-sn-glycerol-3-phosphate acyltransferase [Alphaproteobacteria bacterium]
MATGLSFSVFGAGALVISLTLFPAIHLASFDRRRANLGCQYVVHLSFRFFIWMMKSLGILSYEIVDAEKLARDTGNLIIANHPTLLDVVFIISMLPRTLCVVKKAAWSNPFLAGVMWATGYIQSDDPLQLIAECVQSIEQENNLLIFPEATRTVPGQPLKLKRGAASVIVESQKLFIPLVITCEPSTLTKAEKWFEIPSRKMHFKITVGDKVDPQPLLTEDAGRSKSNRRVNEVIRELFSMGIERHERSG